MYTIFQDYYFFRTGKFFCSSLNVDLKGQKDINSRDNQTIARKARVTRKMSIPVSSIVPGRQ